MDDKELRELFEKPKRDAVALFKDNHDNGDTAIYQFISDIIPLLKARDAAKEREAYDRCLNIVKDRKAILPKEKTAELWELDMVRHHIEGLLRTSDQAKEEL